MESVDAADRRLRRDGLIVRIPHSHRYQVTDTGLSRPIT